MRFYWLFTVIIITTFISCSDTWNIKQSIKLWELNQNNCKVVEFLQLDSLQSFTNADSAKILLKEYSQYKTKKFESLNSELSLIDERIKNTQIELNSSDNALMQKAIRHKLYELDQEREKCLMIIYTYEEDIEITEFKKYENQIKRYEDNPDRIIGTVFLSSFIGKTGELKPKSYQKKYLIITNGSSPVNELRSN